VKLFEKVDNIGILHSFAGVPALMESLGDEGREGGVGDGFHGLATDHNEAVLVDLLVEDRDHHSSCVLTLAGWVVNEVRLTDPGALLFPASDLLSVAVVNLQDGGGALGEEELSDPVEAVLLSLEGGVDDGEVNAVGLRGDDVGVQNFFSIHVDVVATEAHRRRDVDTVGVVEEAEGLEVERILSSDVSGLVGGVDVASHVVVTGVHHEREVASVEFGVSSVSDLHDVELGVLLGVDFEILFHGVTRHETHRAHSHRDLGEHQVISSVAEGVVVPELTVFVGHGADADTLVGSIFLDSVEDLLLLHHSFVVHLRDEADGVAGCNVGDDMSSSERRGLEVVIPLVPSLGGEVVGVELDEVGGVGGEDHGAVGKLPRHNSNVIALLGTSAPVHGDAGQSVSHSLGFGVREEHVLRLAGLHGASVEPVVVDQLGGEAQGVLFAVDSVAVVSEESIHVVGQLVLANLKQGRAGVNQISLEVVRDVSLKLDRHISEVLGQGLGVSHETIHISGEVGGHGEVGVRLESLEGAGTGRDSCDQ